MTSPPPSRLPIRNSPSFASSSHSSSPPPPPPPPLPPKPLKRSTKIYFPDGNIVLVCSSTLFKVHASILSRHSEVFRHMFLLPQPSGKDKNEEIGGCPMVRMYDNPKDLENLLVALYDGLYLPKPRPNTYPILLSTLLLSSKYNIPHLYTQCTSELSTDFPSTLVGWDQRESSSTNSEGYYLLRFHTPHPAFVIPLLWQCGLEDNLAAAYYDLGRYSPSRVWEGTLVHAMEHDYAKREGVARIKLDGKRLGRGEMERVCKGREAGMEYLAWFLDVVLPSIGGGVCLREPPPNIQFRFPFFPPRHFRLQHYYQRTGKRHKVTKCRASLHTLHMHILRLISGISPGGREADPLFILHEMLEVVVRGQVNDAFALYPGWEEEMRRGCRYRLDFCTACYGQVLDAVRKAREGVWEWLPFWFGIKPN